MQSKTKMQHCKEATRTMLMFRIVSPLRWFNPSMHSSQYYSAQYIYERTRMQNGCPSFLIFLGQRRASVFTAIWYIKVSDAAMQNGKAWKALLQQTPKP